MNGIYLIERTDFVGWNEYDAVVVVAPDEGAAFAAAVALSPPNRFHVNFQPDGSNVRVREIIPSQEDVGMILASFNAG